MSDDTSDDSSTGERVHVEGGKTNPTDQKGKTNPDDGGDSDGYGVIRPAADTGEGGGVDGGESSGSSSEE